MGAYEKRVMGRWAAEFTAAMVFYAATLAGAAFVVLRMPEHPARLLLSILPSIPAALVIWIGWRAFRRMDELQQRVALRIIALSAFATAFLTFGYGFLETAGLPHLSLFWVWPVMGALQTILGLTTRWWYK